MDTEHVELLQMLAGKDIARRALRKYGVGDTPNARAVGPKIPLYAAAIGNHDQCVLLLLEAGADVSTSIEHALKNGKTELAAKLRLLTCSHCGIVSSQRALRKCSRCKAVAYCGRDCQVAHWSKHKCVCKKK